MDLGNFVYLLEILVNSCASSFICLLFVMGCVGTRHDGKETVCLDLIGMRGHRQ